MGGGPGTGEDIRMPRIIETEQNIPSTKTHNYNDV